MTAVIEAAVLVPVDDLAEFPGNPRRGDVTVIADSLRRNGQYRPIVANRRTGQVLAGNHTLRAARQLGWSEVAVAWVDVDDELAARIVLVDNRANDLAGYDDTELLALLESIPSIEGTGYDEQALADLQALVGDRPALTDVDDAPPVPAGEPIARRGDLFVLDGDGRHRVLCGDATDPGDLSLLLGDIDLVDAVWTDPPYGVAYVGGTKDALTIRQRQPR